MIDTIEECVHRVGEDSSVRAVIITATGRTFSAGTDLGRLEGDREARTRNRPQASAAAALTKRSYEAVKPRTTVFSFWTFAEDPDGGRGDPYILHIFEKGLKFSMVGAGEGRYAATLLKEGVAARGKHVGCLIEFGHSPTKVPCVGSRRRHHCWRSSGGVSG